MFEKPICDLSDNELVSLAVSGNAEAFSVLLKRYSHRIYAKAKSFGYAQGVEVEDFYQEGVIGFCSAVYSFDPEKSDNFSSFAAVLTEQAMQRFYNSLSCKKNLPLHNYVQFDELSDMESENLSPEDSVIFAEAESEVFSKLSEFEYAVAEFYLLGFSRKAIAEKLNCTLKKVDNAVQRIRNKIKKD